MVLGINDYLADM